MSIHMRYHMKYFLKTFWDVLKKSVKAFSNDNAIKLSASLSYYTIFSFPPLIIIIISLVGYFFGKEATQGEIYGQISSLVGSSSAEEIQSTIRNVHLSSDTFFATIIGIVTLV